MQASAAQWARASTGNRVPNYRYVDADRITSSGGLSVSVDWSTLASYIVNQPLGRPKTAEQILGSLGRFMQRISSPGH
jgi:hypothetical protein